LTDPRLTVKRATAGNPGNPLPADGHPRPTVRLHSGSVPKDRTPVHKPVDSRGGARGAPAADTGGRAAAGARRGLEPVAPRGRERNPQLGGEIVARDRRGPSRAVYCQVRATYGQFRMNRGEKWRLRGPLARSCSKKTRCFDLSVRAGSRDTVGDGTPHYPTIRRWLGAHHPAALPPPVGGTPLPGTRWAVGAAGGGAAEPWW